MQRWEYCVVAGVANVQGEFETSYPGGWYFTSDGVRGFTPGDARGTRLGGKGEKEAVAKRIAELGQQGWELAGVSPGGSGWATLFFKRPLS